MGMNTPQGAEYMRQLALDAGFQKARSSSTGGVPGVFATLDAGAKDTLAIYFMYDVKQYDPAEWSSPPLEGAIVEQARRRQGPGRPRRQSTRKARRWLSSPRCTASGGWA